MTHQQVLPSPRKTVGAQFTKLERLIQGILVDDPNLMETQVGSLIFPSFHATQTPMTRDFVAGPLKAKANKILDEVDRLEEVSLAMAMTPSEMALLSSEASLNDNLPGPENTMSRYIEIMRTYIDTVFINNPSFQPGMDEDGAPVDAELFSLYPMTRNYLQDILPSQVSEIKRVVGNAAGACAIMAMSADERLLLNDIISKLDNSAIDVEAAPEFGM
jgi:hypothetical protein